MGDPDEEAGCEGCEADWEITLLDIPEPPGEWVQNCECEKNDGYGNNFQLVCKFCHVAFRFQLHDA